MENIVKFTLQKYKIYRNNCKIYSSKSVKFTEKGLNITKQKFKLC